MRTKAGERGTTLFFKTQYIYLKYKLITMKHSNLFLFVLIQSSSLKVSLIRDPVVDTAVREHNTTCQLQHKVNNPLPRMTLKSTGKSTENLQVTVPFCCVSILHTYIKDKAFVFLLLVWKRSHFDVGWRMKFKKNSYSLNFNVTCENVENIKSSQHFLWNFLTHL